MIAHSDEMDSSRYHRAHHLQQQQQQIAYAVAAATAAASNQQLSTGQTILMAMSATDSSELSESVW